MQDIKMSNLIKDAIRLGRFIIDSLPYDSTWAVVNIVKIPKMDTIIISSNFPEIPTVFCYTYDKIPELLAKEFVIEAIEEKKWFIKIMPQASINRENSWFFNDKVTETAKKRKYIMSNQQVWYLSPVNQSCQEENYHCTILINVKKLKEFINWYSGMIPKFNVQSGRFDFLGEVLEIDGDIEKKSLSLLLENINSIVTKKEFYEVRGKNDYDTLIKSKKVAPIHDKLKKVFQKLKKKFEKNPSLKMAVVFVQNNGYGIFINNRALIKKRTKVAAPHY